MLFELSSLFVKLEIRQTHLEKQNRWRSRTFFVLVAPDADFDRRDVTALRSFSFAEAHATNALLYFSFSS